MERSINLENKCSWERKVLGTKVSENEKSRELWERKFPEMKSLGNESSREQKVPGTNVSHMDYSFLGAKGLGYKKL